jgi:dTDP-4-dehydrorhamnose 3,5-epimerase
VIVVPTEIPDVMIVQPQLFSDERGFFLESFNQRSFCEKTSSSVEFVQDNHSQSFQNVLRGLHYQIKQPQGKLIRVIVGEILDVAVDIRRSSPTFGQWVSCYLSAENKQQLWIPSGFAHGFLVISEKAEVLYKATDYYAPQYERRIRWDDPDLSINWNLSEKPILSSKDKAGVLLKDAEVYA